MAEIIGVTLWTIAGVVWGDWRDWKKYHATILIFLLFDFVYYYLTCDHRFWSLEPTFPIRTQFAALIGECVVFASTILIYLGHYPDNQPAKAMKWILLWVCIYSVNEFILQLPQRITVFSRMLAHSQDFICMNQ